MRLGSALQPPPSPRAVPSHSRRRRICCHCSGAGGRNPPSGTPSGSGVQGAGGGGANAVLTLRGWGVCLFVVCCVLALGSYVIAVVSVSLLLVGRWLLVAACRECVGQACVPLCRRPSLLLHTLSALSRWEVLRCDGVVPNVPNVLPCGVNIGRLCQVPCRATLAVGWSP